ncbi:MAG TPA: hemolysin III family protein [Thermoanaerobaculia bacterium]|nr:hemolysin III family protein [Thermoanaerobaculia bacterium]
MYPGERFNSITHLVGTVLAIVGTAALITVAAVYGKADARRMTALAVYGAMLVVLYLSSTLYHSLRGRAKRVFHVFDHCAIYLLIAGTYTPFTLVTLRGVWGWTLFGIVWALAAAGVAKDVFLHGRLRGISIMLYVLMGWLVVAAFGPLRAALPMAGIAWLIAGGIAYTAGLAFFALSNRVAHTHGLWHLCVMGGSVCHYVTVFRYVAL